MAFNCINKFGIQTLYNFEKKICFSTENSDKSTELYVYMNDYKYRTKVLGSQKIDMIMQFNANLLKFVNRTSLGCPSKFKKYFSGLTYTFESYLEW